MFDEPIRIGLIRFADVYDHVAVPEDQAERRRWQADFDRSHQPLLVIYTTVNERPQGAPD